jgi:hypothetical protein
MPLDLIAAALILVFAAVVVLGHVLVVLAIYKCLREDYAAGRRASSDKTTIDNAARPTADAANLGETREPQTGNAFRRLGWTEQASSNCPLPAASSWSHVATMSERSPG